MSRIRFCWPLLAGLSLICLDGPLALAQTTNLGPAETLRRVFHPGKLAEIDAALEQAITDKKLPGGVVWLERHGAAYHRAYGRRALQPTEETMTEDTIFDAASLTKVLATAPAIMLLAERGRLQLDARAQLFLPEFTGQGKEAITVRQLLTHTAGLRPGLSRSPSWSGHSNAIRLACAEGLSQVPGAAFHYSDIGYIVLGEIVERVSSEPLEQFARREFYQPLKMVDTGFLPPAAKLGRIAPTEAINGRILRGTVHDPTARLMGGVAGHAGVFTTAADLARFARLWLNEGELEGTRVFRPETVRLMTAVQTTEAVSARRGLGWDIDSPYSGPRGNVFPVGSYGHTGWTGTSLWIDPFSGTFVLLLSNRNHPTGAGEVVPLRRRLGTLAAEAVVGFDFKDVPGALRR